MTPDEIAAARREFANQIEFCKKARARHKNVVVEIFQERIEEMAGIANQALNALEEAQQGQQAAVREAALEETAKLICRDCARNEPLEQFQCSDELLWAHYAGHDGRKFHWNCLANAIRQLMTHP